jgi:hypothetical protein
MPTDAPSEAPPDPSELVTVADAVTAYNYPRRTLERWIADGRLSVWRIPANRQLRYLVRAELVALGTPEPYWEHAG